MLTRILSGTALAVVLATAPAAFAQDTTTTPAPAAPPAAQEETTTPGADMPATEAQPSGDAATDEEPAGTTTETTQVPVEPAEGDDAAEAPDAATDMPADTATETTTPPAADTAEETTTEVTTETAEAGEAEGGFVAEQMEGELLASELIGSSVVNAEGETLGEINDVVVDEQIGVKAVVIGVGGFLGIGEKDVAVGYGDIQQSRDEDGEVVLTLQANKDELTNAPEFVSLEEKMAEEQAATAEVEAESGAIGTSGPATPSTTPATPAPAQ